MAVYGTTVLYLQKRIKMEETKEYKAWAKRLNALNDRINNLTVWNDYAELLQRDYDLLLREDPRLKKEL